MEHVWGPGAGEAVVAVAAEGLHGAAGVCFDDDGFGGVADDDAEAGVGRGRGAVDGARKVGIGQG